MIAQLIGSLIIMGFVGTSPTDPGVQRVCEHLRAGHLGGIILFTRNVTGPAQLAALTNAFKQARPDAIIAVDQEGGLVQRLKDKNGFVGTPYPAQIAKMTPMQQTIEYQVMASQLAEHGITLNFAPVVDLDNNDKPCEVITGLQRSYGNTVEQVVASATRCIEAHHEFGVHTCLKHFPGHGSAQGDTHAGCVDVTDHWSEKELEPFYQLKHHASATMTAHITHRDYGDQPATLSPHLLKKLLRNKGYTRPIISDDLHMGALWWRYSIQEVVVRAINAGVDALVYSNMPTAALSGMATHAESATSKKSFEPDHDMPLKVITAMQQAVSAGQISVNQLAVAASRVATLRRAPK